MLTFLVTLAILLVGLLPILVALCGYGINSALSACGRPPWFDRDGISALMMAVMLSFPAALVVAVVFLVVRLGFWFGC